MTQCEKVLRHLKDHGKITTMDAFVEYGITRLSGRIYDLRKAGHIITSTTVTGRNRYGEPTHFTVYSMEVKAA